MNCLSFRVEIVKEKRFLAGGQTMLQAAQLIFKQGSLVELDGMLFDVISDKLVAVPAQEYVTPSRRKDCSISRAVVRPS